MNSDSEVISQSWTPKSAGTPTHPFLFFIALVVSGVVALCLFLTHKVGMNPLVIALYEAGSFVLGGHMVDIVETHEVFKDLHLVDSKVFVFFAGYLSDSDHYGLLDQSLAIDGEKRLEIIDFMDYFLFIFYLFLLVAVILILIYSVSILCQMCFHLVEQQKSSFPAPILLFPLLSVVLLVLAGEDEDIGSEVVTGIPERGCFDGFLHRKEKHFFPHFVETFIVDHALVYAL
jgi:p-aminobenzoyl-glutamate transporter AbgT